MNTEAESHIDYAAARERLTAISTDPALLAHSGVSGHPFR